MTMRDIRVLAICGSLRRRSSNAELLAALARAAPPNVTITLFDGLAALPAFSPDFDADGNTPAGVARFRRLLEAHDAVVISSPEYAHGMPGALKNALDWVVGSGELIAKPVAVVNASTHATRAWRSLVDTLGVMSACVVEEASVTVPVQGRGLDADGIHADPALLALLTSLLQTLAGVAIAGR
jgi:NAD(P)H-dependent FMN reductase